MPLHRRFLTLAKVNMMNVGLNWFGEGNTFEILEQIDDRRLIMEWLQLSRNVGNCVPVN
jgi:hypothetical protein